MDNFINVFFETGDKFPANSWENIGFVQCDCWAKNLTLYESVNESERDKNVTSANPLWSTFFQF